MVFSGCCNLDDFFAGAFVFYKNNGYIMKLNIKSFIHCAARKRPQSIFVYFHECDKQKELCDH